MISKGPKSDKELKLEEKAKILRQSKSAKKSVPSVEEFLKEASKLMGGEKSIKERMVPAKKASGGAMKTKGYAKGGAMKTKGYAKGGAMKTKGASKGGKMRVRPPSSKKSGLYGR